MLIYSGIFNVSVISILFYWKIAVPMLIVVLVPMGLNIWWLALNEEKRKELLDKNNKSQWWLTLFYTTMGLIAVATFAFFMVFLMSIFTF